MPRVKRPRRVRFTVVLTGDDLARWEHLASLQGISLEQVARESVELAYARGSTR